MRVAGRFVLTILTLLVVWSTISVTVQPIEKGKESPLQNMAVLCGTISENTTTEFEFYVTCSVTVQAGVTLEMIGLGYVSPFVSIDIYGTLLLHADLTWNATSPPPDPNDWRWYGIHIRSLGHIEANWFSIKHAYYGIGLWDTSGGNIISHGSFEDITILSTMNEGSGVQINGSNNNTVEYSTFSNTVDGVNIIGNSRGNVVRYSTFANSALGVTLGQFTDVSENQIICNDFTNNTFHVYSFEGSNSNIIHHNNFYSPGSAVNELHFPHNKWDDGYPNGGNYWHDYLGNDSFRGPSQDIPGPDRIGDEPHIVPWPALGIFDNYPFYNPVPKSGCPSPPPEMPSAPLPPTNVVARLDGLSFSNVNISWELSQSDGVSPDFQNYAVYYSEDYDRDGAEYRILAEVPPGQSYFVHVSAGHGNPCNYYYYVQANSSSGIPGKNDRQVAKFTENLIKGWNLISVPLITDNSNLQSVFQTITLDRAMVYSSAIGTWREFNSAKPYQDFDSLAPLQGVWVETRENGNWTIAGVVPLSTSIDLVSGWNLVAYPSLIERDVSTALSGIPYEAIEGFDSGPNPYHLRKLASNEVMTPGQGYWIRVSAPCVWTIEN